MFVICIVYVIRFTKEKFCFSSFNISQKCYLYNTYTFYHYNTVWSITSTNYRTICCLYLHQMTIWSVYRWNKYGIAWQKFVNQKKRKNSYNIKKGFYKLLFFFFGFICALYFFSFFLINLEMFNFFFCYFDYFCCYLLTVSTDYKFLDLLIGMKKLYF